jgi:hypothetical protein
MGKNLSFGWVLLLKDDSPKEEGDAWMAILPEEDRELRTRRDERIDNLEEREFRREMILMEQNHIKMRSVSSCVSLRGNLGKYKLYSQIYIFFI